LQPMQIAASITATLRNFCFGFGISMPGAPS
jgi:hypothetical protein